MIIQLHWLRQQLIQEIRQPETTLNLARAALLIAAEDHPDLDLAGYLRQFDEFAGIARARLRGGRSPVQALETVRRLLFEELGFTGARDDYYNPRNSYLHDVLDRRIGIPITLSIVFMEVGWRLGLPLAGAGMPGHFLVRYQDAEGTAFIDPFHGGRVLDENGCIDLMRQAVGDRLAFRSEFLWPISKRQILSRVLGNLKVIYQQREDNDRTLAMLDRMLLLDPDGPAELQERSRLYAGHRALALAQTDLRRLLERGDRASLAQEARQELERLQRLWYN